MRLTITIAFLGAVLTAVGCYESEAQYGGESHFLRCEKTADCGDLGDEYACVVGRCRADAAESTGPKSTSSGATGSATGGRASTASNANDAGAVSIAISDATPLVVFVVDTSGSMERTNRCSCTSPSCAECLPDCESGELNRWTTILEVLTGTFDDFACEALERTEANGMTYDVGYYLPYHRPSGTQRSDGLLDEYRERLRFGVATFDGFDTYAGAPPLVDAAKFEMERSAGEPGLWSYNPASAISDLHSNRITPQGDFFYPNCTVEYLIDTGIRSEAAEQGALRIASDPSHAMQVNDAIQDSLVSLRPYGGTPIASAFDDLYYYMDQDPAMAVERTHPAPRHVVLITDGYPDDDYRSFGCDCADRGGSTPCGGNNDASKMHCPYPTAEAAAHALHCGNDLEHCAGPATQVDVIGFDIDDAAVKSRLDAIAVAGGAQRAHYAASKLALRDALERVLGEIAK